nr:ionotropic glutamate receptor 11 [Achelura yunnanensis]
MHLPLKCLLLLYIFIYRQSLTIISCDKIPIGVIFDQNTEEIQNAFKLAMVHYLNPNQSRLDIQVNVDLINTADAFKLSRLICNQFGRGVVAMFGSVTADAFDTLHSYANTFQMPFITPWFPEKVIPPSSGLRDYAISLRPDYHKAVIDTIKYYGWKNVIYIYDSHDGLLRLQQLYISLKPGRASFRISCVKRVSSAYDVLLFLRALERIDRWTNKYVILDSTTRLAKETLVTHVRDVQLGRRNYHYLLTGLVMDDRWEKEVMEFGAINVTGFRLLDMSKTIVQNFIGLWKSNSVSAKSVLMYDAVHLVIDAIFRIFRKKPDVFRSVLRRNSNLNSSKMIDCDPSGQGMSPYDHGDKISRMIKKTEIEGLTGPLRFNDAGQRLNFTLHVIEMTYEADMVKIATWYDYKGFIPIKPKMLSLSDRGLYDRNKTYIVATIEEPPYVLRSLDNNGAPTEILKGFCIDLTKLLAEKLEIKYEIHLVKDGKYGSDNPKIIGGWDGLVGELLRKEADIVIAPLTVTLEREAVIDFTKPFLSFDMKPNKNTSVGPASIFMFLSPYSKEIWLCILFCLIVVSIVLFIVSRFSYHPSRLVTLPVTRPSENNDDENNQVTVINELTFWNSIWFTVGSFMQQGSNIVPRSVSAKIVSTVWWFFTFIVISTYTANFTSYLTLAKINEPTLSYNKIVSCPEDSTIGAIEDEIIAKQEDSWFSFILDRNAKKRDNKRPCEMLVTITNAGVKEFAVALPKGSILREGINLATQTLKNEGELQRLVRKWFFKTECSVSEKGLHSAELTLTQVAGLFYVLMGGLALALVVGLFEFCQNGRREAALANISFREALQARVGLNSDATRQPPANQTNRQRELDRDHSWNRGAYTGYYTAANQSGQEETSLSTSFAQV